MARYSKPRFAYEAELRSLHAQGYTDSEIGEAVGRSRVAIGTQRRKYGLPSNRPHQRFIDRCRNVTKKMVRDRGLKNFCGLRQQAWKDFARRNGWPEDLWPREVTILNALLERGPMTRRQICDAIGLRWCGRNSSLKSHRPGHSTHLGYLASRGLVVRLGTARNVSCRYTLGFAVEPIPVSERMLA